MRVRKPGDSNPTEVSDDKNDCQCATPPCGRWERYAEENPEIASKSRLVRLAVEREINGDDAGQETPEEVAEATADELEAAGLNTGHIATIQDSVVPE